MKKQALGLLLLGALWLASPLVFNAIQPNDYSGGNTRDEQQRRVRNSSAAARMLGGLRTSVSDVMFLKIQTYMHEGVGYEPHVTEVESLSSLLEDEPEIHEEDIHEEGRQDDHAEHAHEEEHVHSEQCSHGPAVEGETDEESGEALYAGETSIPKAEKDYRGFIGNLYRKVKPWSGATLHKHSKGEELLPWFKIMTLSDPHYIRGYTIGSYWLSRTDVDGALKYIDEGAKNNAESFEVHLIYGQILYKKAQNLKRETGDQDLPLAYSYLQRALQHFNLAADQVLPLRPAEGPTEDSDWTLTQEQDAWAAVGMAMLMESKYGDPEKAQERAKYFKAQMGDSPTFENIINPVTSVLPSYLQ